MQSCRWGLSSILWLLLIFIFGRVGEAQHPGPRHGDDHFSVSSESDLEDENPSTIPFFVGTCNSTGIAHKAASFLGLPCGVWGVAETQATANTFSSFKREFQFLGRRAHRRLRALHGEFAPLRPGSTHAGSWTGVALLSDHPIRPLNLPWLSVEYSSGRALVGNVFVGQLHILAAVVYLPPTGPTYGTTTSICNELLTCITVNVIYGSGLRYVCGDFNRDPHHLSTFDLWRAAGWIEVQSWAMEKFNRDPTPTSKGTAFSDHIWVSPELARYMTEVHLLEEVFSEHDPLCAEFRLPTGPLKIQHWPTPALFPWAQHEVVIPELQDFDFSSFDDDPTKAFARWSNQVEQGVLTAFREADIQLPRGVTGRGQTLQPVSRQMRLPPLRHGRAGEEVPLSDFLNRQMHAWFKQLRRLQAYVQRASSMTHQPAKQIDQCRTWSNVIRATGFKAGFSSWWASRRIQLHGSPEVIPCWPPDHHTANLIFIDFRQNYRALERWQVQRRKQLISVRAHDHNRLLHKQLRQQDMAPPDHFTLKSDLLITDVLDTTTVEVDDDIPFSDGATWLLQGVPATVQPLGPQCLHIETDLILKVGQKLVGTLVVSDFDRMESALSTLWLPIWQRHMEEPPERWQRALAFMDAYLPRLPAIEIAWNDEKVNRLAKGYKKRTATGADGWARDDVANLSLQAHGQIAQMYDRIQHGAAWPRQLQTGLVCPVQKSKDAELPSQYRPIILLPFLYRLWAVGSARSLLPQMLQVAGQHVYGFLPSRRVSDLWWLLQAAVETSFFDRQEMTGFNLDLIKCFNFIPRDPIFWGMKRLGLPENTLQAWSNGLRQLERRFRLGCEVGPPHRSTCGFPEGDPLSCCAMVFFDVVMDLYVSQYCSQVQLVSYVDNIQLLADGVGSLCSGLVVLRTCLDMFDLAEDKTKSFAWATSTSLRNQLRGHGLQVRLAIKDLGAQMTFSQLIRATTTTERVAGVQHFWPILARSPVHRWFKLLAIRSAAWARALHACENRLAPSSVTAKLRTKAQQALGWRRAGSSPWIRWSLMLPYDMDPDFYQYWAILRTALRMFQLYSHVHEQWGNFADADHPPHGQGPLHSLWQVLQLLGWSWDRDLTLEVDGLVFSFADLHLMLLRRLLETAWDRIICSKMPDRLDFQGLTSVDRLLSFQSITDTVADSELLNTIQDGTFYTEYQLSKFDPTRTGMCSRCGVEDDLAHRCLTCPLYESIRRAHQPCVHRWHEHGTAFTHHGLVPGNPVLPRWWQYLASIPDTVETYYLLPSDGVEYNLFTDGTCADRGVPEVAHAAWAVVIPDLGRILAHGHVPNICQSNNRAEILAVLSALSWKRLAPCSINIWTDSKHVVDCIAHLRRYDEIPHHWHNMDLWLRMRALVRVLDWSTCAIHWVASHRDPAMAVSSFDEWQILGNAMADRAAVRCNLSRGNEFEEIFKAFTNERLRLQRLATSQRQFLLAISKADLRTSMSTEDSEAEDQMVGSLGCDLQVNDCFVASCLEPILEPRAADFPLFQHEFISHLVSWLSGVDILAPYKRPISLVEILFGFVASTGRAFPVATVGGPVQRYVYPCDLHLGALMRQTVSGSCQILKQALENVFQIAQADVQIIRAARVDVNILFPVPCVVMGWPDDLYGEVSGLILKFASHPLRRARDLARTYRHVF